MHHKHPSPFRHAVLAAKLLAGGAIVAWLAWQAQQDDQFQKLASGEKQWGVLLLAVVLTGFNVLMTFVRWYFVSRAAGVPLRLGEAISLGTLGYTLNFVGPGAIGGDLFKGAVLAKDRPGHRTAAITTIVVDRALALLSLLFFACFGFLLIQSTGVELPVQARAAGWTAVGVAACVPIVLGVLLAPGVLRPAVIESASRLPGVGHVLAQVLASWAEYRRGLKFLLVAFALCVAGHCALVSSFYLVAVGLPLEAPSLLNHVFMVPFACLAGVFPLLPGGLGATEGTLEFLYRWFGGVQNAGGFVAFGYRLSMIAIAFITAPYYLTHQALVKRTMAEVEASPEPE